MRTHTSEDKMVTKHVHDDGSETCIKTVPSLDVNATTETVETVDRDKYSIFVSDSRGCPFNCKFCYLTIDDVPYGKLTDTEVTRNIMDAMHHRVKVEPEIVNRYAKLCWMGMGEPILRSAALCRITLDVLDWLSVTKYAKGLDGVDVSTVLPKLKNELWLDQFVTLNSVLGTAHQLNPNNRKADNVGKGSSFVTYKDRSVFRLFYSLHSAIQTTRDKNIPNAMPLKDALEYLRILQDSGVNVIFHHMFLNGVNDTEEEVEAVVEAMSEFPDSELRILRYNKHENSDVRESEVFKHCMCLLGDRVAKVKVQVSQGADVRSACGQFMYNHEPQTVYPKVEIEL